MAEEPRDSELMDEVVAQCHRCHRESRDATNEWRTMAPKWYDLVANKQWDDEDIDALEAHDRIPVVINRVARAVNAIIGTQVSNRQETRYIPREEGDVKINEILTGAADWVRDGCDAEDEESDAFEDTTICGMGWTETRLDYEQDPEGTTLIDRIDPLWMYWDPNAKKRNLADAKWVLRLKDIPLDEFIDRWGEEKLAGMLTDPWDTPPSDLETREHVYPQEAYQHQQGASGRSRKRSIRVAQYQYAVRVPMYRVGKAAERITEEAFDKLKDRLKEAGVEHIKQTGVRWKQAFIAGGQLLEEIEDCPYPDGPTFRAITYKRDRNKNTWYGVVAAMMDPQKYGNKFLSLIMDILRANAKGGVMMEKDAVDDPKEIEEKWAKPDAIVFTRPGAVSGGKILERPKAVLPAGLDRLTAYFLDSVHEVTGINLELLGMANRDQAGVLENTRKQAGVTIIAPLFDGLRRYRKEQGRVLLYFIQTYLSDDRLVRITGINPQTQKEGQHYVKLSKQSQSARYDVVVDESPTSPNMKEKTFGALVDLVPNLLKAGVPVPPSILKYAPLPSSLVEEWMQFIEQRAGAPSPEEVQKLQQENQELKQQKDVKMAELQMDQAKAQNDMAIEREKMQLEREKMTVEIEIQRIKLQLEQEKAAAEMQLAEQKASQELALNQQKARAQLEMSERDAAGKLDLERRKVDADAHVKVAGSRESIDRIFSENIGKRSKKRKFKVVRDGAGEMAGIHEE